MCGKSYMGSRNVTNHEGRIEMPEVSGAVIDGNTEKPDFFGRIVFLGGIIPESQSENIERNSKVGVQHAADALQKAILLGLSQHEGVTTSVVNLPFIGSYPRADRAAFVRETTSHIYGRIRVLGAFFLNIAFLRGVSRYISSLRCLRRELAGSSPCTIIVYSAHIPFLRAAIKLRRERPYVRLVLVLPDFIEHMAATSRRQKFNNQRNARKFYGMLSQIDYYILLTAAMADHLKLNTDRFSIVEGIDASLGEGDLSGSPDGKGPIFIYTGTLAKRYGILDLLDAFSKINIPSSQLWICGDGDARAAVEESARADRRITYHGRVTRPAAIALQARAHVAVNPRRPEGEFTKFSFPSKTIEYLASGRPVVMHWLPGIPEEYRPYLIVPDTPDVAGLAASLKSVAERPLAELLVAGARGREFIQKEKSPHAQIRKIMDKILGNDADIIGKKN